MLFPKVALGTFSKNTNVLKNMVEYGLDTQFLFATGLKNKKINRQIIKKSWFEKNSFEMCVLNGAQIINHLLLRAINI